MSPGFQKREHKKTCEISYFISRVMRMTYLVVLVIVNVCVNAGNRTRASWFQACTQPLFPISSSRRSFLTDLLCEKRETLPIANNVIFIVTVWLRSYSYILSEETDWEYWENCQVQGFCLLCLLCSCPFSYELRSFIGFLQCSRICVLSLGLILKFVLSFQLFLLLYWLFICLIHFVIIFLL